MSRSVCVCLCVCVCVCCLAVVWWLVVCCVLLRLFGSWNCEPFHDVRVTGVFRSSSIRRWFKGSSSTPQASGDTSNIADLSSGHKVLNHLAVRPSLCQVAVLSLSLSLSLSPLLPT